MSARRFGKWGFRVYAKIGTGCGRVIVLRGKRTLPKDGEKVWFQDAWDADQMGRHAAAHRWTPGTVDAIVLDHDGDPWMYRIRLD